MDPARIDRILDLLTPAEVAEALWMVSVFERSHMPPDEAAEWRRRILARQRFLELDGNTMNGA